ncbi:MAG: sigma-70 family RNA polymerase sigma factor [Lachnospiraceae bacterium]|nr:sigma-70 family RNA polymerase sigma factor [Lachnospiraceae bacterium]
MNKQDAEKVITEYVKPIFGFALKRCKSEQDAEDLAQEIVLKAFKALLIKDSIVDAGKFIWTIAHNTLSNYYRGMAKAMVGVSIDEVAETLADPNTVEDADDDREVIGKLQKEVAYLSKLQRRIVIAYYFENRKQADIARELEIPEGTVKWHLFEAKKELKRGMDKMREASELKFNPIKFEVYGVSGSVGTKSPDEFLRSALSQNICYCIRKEAKTINEIAENLAVSPVFVEGEVEFLEEYGFLLKQKDRYIANFLIEESTEAELLMYNDLNKQVAELFANNLYEDLMNSGILEDSGILCNQTDDSIGAGELKKADKNYLLWTLIPYITASSGKSLMDKKISFEEVATIRPDGAENIYHAEVLLGEMNLPEEFAFFKRFGPMWNGIGQQMMWQMDSPWSDRTNPMERNIPEEQERVMALYNQEKEDKLSKRDYAWLVERGYIKTNGDYDGDFKSAWQIVILTNPEIKNKLLSVGERIKEKYQAEFEALKAPYVEAVLRTVPAHLRKVKEFELQFIFHSDGWFLLHCINVLLENGKLQLPTESQRKSLTTIICPT